MTPVLVTPPFGDTCAGDPAPQLLTQSEHTQPNDDLFAGGDAGDESVQNAVITDERHDGLRKLGITRDIQRSAAVKHRQRLTEERERGQRLKVKGQTEKTGSGEELDLPGRNRKFGTFGESLR